MRRLSYIMAIFLIFGLLGASNCVFAQGAGSTGSDITLQHTSILSENFIPLLKSGGSSKKIHGADDVSDAASGASTGDLPGWVIIIIVIIIIAIIAIAVWYFFLRK